MSKHTIPMQAQRGLRTAALVAAVAALAGCNALSNFMGRGDDYKSTANASKVRPLEVPPDLTQLARDNRYALPEGAGTATASTYMQQRGAQAAAPAATASGPVAPNALGDIRVERAGNTRWLAVKQPPEQVFALVKDFWQANGFLIVAENAQTGVLETDWTENRSKIPQDGIRRALGRAIDGLYSTGERDKFRTRLERTADGGTEIYISHRGAEEVLTGITKDTTTWTVRPTDPNLEAQYLQRMMAHLGTGEEKARTAVASAPAAPAAAQLVGTPGGGTTHVLVNEGYDRAWRRVGLALDRAGFTVEDRDRVAGVYFVRFAGDGADKQAQPGFFKRLFTWNSKQEEEGKRYRIWVRGDAASTTQVYVLNEKSEPETSPAAARIHTLLAEQLK